VSKTRQIKETQACSPHELQAQLDGDMCERWSAEKSGRLFNFWRGINMSSLRCETETLRDTSFPSKIAPLASGCFLAIRQPWNAKIARRCHWAHERDEPSSELGVLCEDAYLM
jgi:hypothetical protein